MSNDLTSRRERGQTLIVGVLFMSVLLGFTAMAIDVGMFYEDRRHLQNSSDAAALAGTQELPLDPTGAKQKARDWAISNGIDSSQISKIEVQSRLSANDTVYVELTKEFSWIFGRVLGKTTSDVSADAAATVGSLGGNSEMMPWAILEGDTDCLDASGNALFGATCTVKVGAGSAISGWYGALDYDGIGGGSSEYQSNIVDGLVETVYCADGTFNDPCPGTVAVHDLDGNKTGGTGAGIDARLASEPTSSCNGDGDGVDDFDEVFEESSGLFDYIVVCPDSPRLVIIPIVSYSGVPVQTVTIQGWTLAYLKSYACVDGQANNCGAKGHWEVQVEIVNASYSQVNGYLDAFNPLIGITVRRLVE